MSVPGLSISVVAPALVATQFGNVLAGIEDDAAREEKQNELIDFYTNGDGGAEIQGKIDLLNSMYDTIDAALTALTAAGPSCTSAKAVPAVLVVGQATGAPNPGYSSLINAAFKSIMNSTLQAIKVTIQLFKYNCDSVAFDSSVAIAAIEAKVTAAETAISSVS